MPGERARSALRAGRAAGFVELVWVAETGSTNADAMTLARTGAPEGLVVVADHQTAGRGRLGRVWSAPPDGSLLASVLLRPPTSVRDLCTMAMAVAASDAVVGVAGFEPRLKWPNDLVWPGDGGGADLKLAGILAESDGEAVVVGIGINVDWPADLPPELADVAVACNHVTGHRVDREALLVALLERLVDVYEPLVATLDRTPLLERWRARSATLGRRVRADLGAEQVVGTAVDVTPEGFLVIEEDDGVRRTVVTGDVVHLRPE